jgi:hypothetical protein
MRTGVIIHQDELRANRISIESDVNIEDLNPVLHPVIVPPSRT